MPAPRATRRWQSVATVCLVGGLVAALWNGLDLAATHPALAALVLGLFAVNATWLAGAALTALAGIRSDDDSPMPRKTSPDGQCAVLWLVCGEAPEPVAARVREFLGGLAETGQAETCRVFILSDTSGSGALARESAAFEALGGAVVYRNRPCPEGRKPGNLRDWLASQGQRFETMLVLDADSGFSAERLLRLRARMAAQPRLGLLQCGIRLRPGTSRFVHMQRLSTRLCGPVFGRGLARLSDDAGNYWGHNALIRVAAFREIARLPVLSGRAPMGGPVLSHDFIEAAFLRRAGWDVRIDPDSRGSFEDPPETVAAHMRRDRRWAQGNLQHLRLIGAPGLHPASRLHLLAGIQSYLSAPIWLALVVLFGSGAVHASAAAVWPLLGMLGLLMVPKLAGLLSSPRRLCSRWRRAVALRSFATELALSTMFAPLSMVRSSGFVIAVAMGRDGGWVPAGAAGNAGNGRGVPETAAGAAILLAVTVPQAVIGSGPGAALWAGLIVLPVTLPLLAARWLVGWFDQPRRVSSHDKVAAYYDASTRRFLAMGQSRAALAIHRPLWAPGVGSAEEAAAHVNALIAREAEARLGRAPASVRDLGCGVGGTLFQLGQLWPEADLSGVTLSREQVRLARGHARTRGVEARCRFLRSDFTLPTTLPRAELVVAVESHVHAESADAFLRAVRVHLRPGGIVIVVDDMLARDEQSIDGRGRGLVDALRRGWRLGHVTPRDGLVAGAERLGYRVLSTQDLGPYLRLDRLRDRILRLVGPAADAFGLGRIAIFANMIGGNALTEAHRAGIMSYSLVSLQERGAALGAAASPDTGKPGETAA